MEIYNSNEENLRKICKVVSNNLSNYVVHFSSKFDLVKRYKLSIGSWSEIYSISMIYMSDLWYTQKLDFEKLYYHINFNIRFLRISLIFNTMVNAIYQEIWKSKTRLLRDFSRESRDDRVA